MCKYAVKEEKLLDATIATDQDTLLKSALTRKPAATVPAKSATGNYAKQLQSV